MLLAAPGSGARLSTPPDSAHRAPAPPRETLAPNSVLVLYPDNQQRAANVLFDRSFRDHLGSLPGAPADCFSEFLDEEHFPTDYQDRMRDFLRAKYDERPPAVIVAFAAPSLEFCSRYCSLLFPRVPIVFAAMGAESTWARGLGPGVTGVRSSFDGARTLRLALQLHPRTRHVFIVADESDGPVDQEFESTLHASGLQARLQAVPPQPLPQFLNMLAQLPENSLVIDLAVLGRSNATTFPPAQRVEWMARTSRAPVWAACDPLVGDGIVGAITTPMETIGQATAEMAVQVLQEANVDSLPAVRILAATPVFDWRQLRRWNIHIRQIPDGALVRFKPPSLWQQYSTQMITAGGLFLLQSGLILALVLQSRRRRRAEREAQRRRDELTHMTRVATMGELTASLAHEINQPLAAILTNAQAAQRLLAAGGTDRAEIGEILADIATDDRRAGEVIRRMRSLLRKGEGDPTILDVNDLVNDVVGLVRGEMILQNVSLALELAPGPPRVRGDRIQLQQVLLNLMMNALDAMKEVSGGNPRVVVRTTVDNDRSVQISVEDSGGGVAAEKLEQIFEPFVTTKPHGMGLGLSICRSIIQAHGGRIGFTNNADRGATFWFTLPGVEEAKS